MNNKLFLERLSSEFKVSIPNSNEKEVRLLSTVIQYPDCVPLFIELISNKDYFYNDSNRIIYDAIKKIYSNGRTPDLITIKDYLALNNLISIDDNFSELKVTNEYLMTLFNASFGTEYLKEDCTSLMELYKRRGLLTLSSDLRNIAYSSNNVDDTIGSFYSNINDLFNFNSNSVSTVYDEAVLALKTIENRLSSSNGLAGEYLFGVRSLDEMINGYEAGDVIGIGGIRGSGKSSLVNTILEYRVRNNKPTYFWSGEATKSNSVLRLVSALSTVSTNDIKSGTFYESDSAKVFEAIERLNNANVFLETDSMTAEKLEQRIVYYKKLGVDLFILDRQELVQSSLRESSDVTNASDITKKARLLASKYNICIVILAQGAGENYSLQNMIPRGSHALLGKSLTETNYVKIIYIVNTINYNLSEYPDILADVYRKYSTGANSEGSIFIYCHKNNNGNSGISTGVICNFIKENQLIAEKSDLDSDFTDSTIFDIVSDNKPSVIGNVNKGGSGVSFDESFF